jgi:hypothetical protein
VRTGNDLGAIASFALETTPEIRPDPPVSDSNLTSLCRIHHLQGVHMGRIRVWGSAPDQLHWEVVERR